MKTEQTVATKTPRKIKVTASEREEVLMLRTQLVRNLGKREKQHDEIAQLVAKSTALAGEIKAGEKKLNPLDDAACASLSAKKFQLSQVQARLQKLQDDEPARAEDESKSEDEDTTEAAPLTPEQQCRRTYKQIPTVLKPILEREYVRLCEEITSAFEPYYIGNGRAAFNAKQSDVAMQYSGALGFAWVISFEPTSSHYAKALAWLESVLSGNCPVGIEA